VNGGSVEVGGDYALTWYTALVYCPVQQLQRDATPPSATTKASAYFTYRRRAGRAGSRRCPIPSGREDRSEAEACGTGSRRGAPFFVRVG